MSGGVKSPLETAATWIVYWEGALITHFFGVKWAILWCVAWLLIAAGVRIGRNTKA